MSRKARNRMTRETIPKDFSAPMAFVDLLPVVFFGLSAVKAGNLFHSGLFVAGAVVCLLSGVVKVGWKLIAAVSQRNIWPMFVQMRVLMPVGFLTMFAALIVDRAGLNGEAMLAKLSGFPACLFFLAGAWDDFDARFRVPDGFERPEGELDGADRQQPCADLLFHRADAGLTLCIERKKRAACGRLLLHQAMKKNECERCFNEYRK